MFNKLKGYKTYAVAGLAIVYAVSAFATGHITANDAVQIVMAACGGAAMRSAITDNSYNQMQKKDQ